MSARRSKKVSVWKRLWKEIFPAKKRNSSKGAGGLLRSSQLQRLIGLCLVITSIVSINAYIFYFRKQSALHEIIKMARVNTPLAVASLNTSTSANSLLFDYKSFKKVTVLPNKTLETIFNEQKDQDLTTLTAGILTELQKKSINIVRVSAKQFFWFHGNSKDHKALLYPYETAQALWVQCDLSKMICTSENIEGSLQSALFTQKVSGDINNVIPQMRYLFNGAVEIPPNLVSIRGSLLQIGGRIVCYERLDGFETLGEEGKTNEKWIRFRTPSGASEYVNKDGRSIATRWLNSPFKSGKDISCQETAENTTCFPKTSVSSSLSLLAICTGKRQIKGNSLILTCDTTDGVVDTVTYEFTGISVKTQGHISKGVVIAKLPKTGWSIKIAITHGTSKALLGSPWPRYQVPESDKVRVIREIDRVFNERPSA